jgi:hypothetical protein
MSVDAGQILGRYITDQHVGHSVTISLAIALARCRTSVTFGSLTRFGRLAGQYTGHCTRWPGSSKSRG